MVDLLDGIDVRLRSGLRRALEDGRRAPLEGLPRGVTVVLVGHRAAGKSTLLPKVAAALSRPGIDLDEVLARRSGRSLRDWVRDDEAGFRVAEREAFEALPAGVVVAAGGGFLATHATALRDCVAVLVPVSFETYRERLLADATRPRLRPGVPLEVELHDVYAAREALHRRARPMDFVEFVLRLERGLRARRVVTLPPGAAPADFAWRARHEGAEVLEVRSDLLPHELALLPASRALPLLVSQRTHAVPEEWLALASLVDVPLGSTLEVPSVARLVVSLHAERPLTTAEALAAWVSVPDGALVKHVEPLGPLGDAGRLLETQARLVERFGAERVTVLVTGPLALPFRAVLAEGNALDYLALEGGFSAAVGQRLLADAVRASRRAASRARLGLLGHAVGHSRSPRLHPRPFERIDVPEDADVAGLLSALRPWYRGFAVTTPFKQAVARAVGAAAPAVNTVWRVGDGYAGASTDAAGAAAVLKALGAAEVTVLGRGGVSSALEEAASSLGVRLRFVRAAEVTEAPVRGAVVWAWPVDFSAPAALRFEAATVAVIAYGRPSARVVAAVESRGGYARRLGPRWFVAQLRAQRALWPDAGEEAE